MNQVLTVKEAAQKLRVSTILVYAMCRDGRIAHARLGKGKGTIRIAAAALEQLLQGSALPEASKPAPRSPGRPRKQPVSPESCPVMDGLLKKYQAPPEAAG